jgi:hypothetical protein
MDIQHNLQAIITVLKKPRLEPLTELATLNLPDYASEMVKHLTRTGVTNFRRRDDISVGALLSMMSKLQAMEGHVWPQVASLFVDVSLSKAVSAAENDDEEEFCIYQRIIHDFFPLMDCAKKKENCKFKSIPFESIITLFALIDYESA